MNSLNSLAPPGLIIGRNDSVSKSILELVSQVPGEGPPPRRGDDGKPLLAATRRRAGTCGCLEARFPLLQVGVHGFARVVSSEAERKRLDGVLGCFLLSQFQPLRDNVLLHR